MSPPAEFLAGDGGTDISRPRRAAMHNPPLGLRSRKFSTGPINGRPRGRIAPANGCSTKFGGLISAPVKTLRSHAGAAAFALLVAASLLRVWADLQAEGCGFPFEFR